MSNDINLLPRTKASKSQDEKYKYLLRRVAVGFVIVTVLAAIGIFTLRVISPTQVLKQNENGYLTSIGFSQLKIAKLLFIQSRVKAIDQLLNSRISYADTISSIKSGIPSNVKIDSFVLTRVKIIITATSNTLSSLDDFLTKTSSILSARPNFKKLIISNIVADETSRSYHISIEADSL